MPVHVFIKKLLTRFYLTGASRYAETLQSFKWVAVDQEREKYDPSWEPYPACEGPIFWDWMSTFDLNLAHESQIKSQCGPRMKIVAHPC